MAVTADRQTAATLTGCIHKTSFFKALLSAHKETGFQSQKSESRLIL